MALVYGSKSNGDPPGAKAKRHLYVVLDNHDDSYGVHKLDLSDDHDTAGGPRRHPAPPVLRVVLTTLGDRVQFAAVGSSIVATGTTIRSPLLHCRFIPAEIGGVLIYDVDTAELTVTPHLPMGLVWSGYKAAMAVGNTLYMLGSEPPQDDFGFDPDNRGGSLHCLTADLDPDHAEEDYFWHWEPLSDTSPWFWSGFESPPGLPFMAEDIVIL
ncbi:hypothetical protein ACQ4PT_059157 [Festuca glaucescens]